ncbi:competence/damage-inducible protein A, partial [Candidatus Aerophobetes bacterium]|nr:competence/damage-inducible protein A [Candidatus Aerophobetes bacterium]
TTGGVGAEDKDQTIEGITLLDPDAAISYVVHYKKGEGRHVKDGVRVCVGEYEDALIIAIPGPHEEVRVVAEVLLKMLKRRIRNKRFIAERIAISLREHVKSKLGWT